MNTYWLAAMASLIEKAGGEGPTLRINLQRYRRLQIETVARTLFSDRSQFMGMAPQLLPSSLNTPSAASTCK